MARGMKLNMYHELVIGAEMIPSNEEVNEVWDKLDEFAGDYKLNSERIDELNTLFVKAWLHYQAYGSHNARNRQERYRGVK